VPTQEIYGHPKWAGWLAWATKRGGKQSEKMEKARPSCLSFLLLERLTGQMVGWSDGQRARWPAGQVPSASLHPLLFLLSLAKQKVTLINT